LVKPSFKILFSFWYEYVAQVDHIVSLDQQTSEPVEGLSIQTGGPGLKFMHAIHLSFRSCDSCRHRVVLESQSAKEILLLLLLMLLLSSSLYGDYCLLACDAMCFGNFLPVFWRNLLYRSWVLIH